jgi:hypothetical protein
MRSAAVVVVFYAALFCALNPASAALTTAGAVSNVVVYRGQALVTRVIDVPLPAGNSEIVVTGLPNRIKPESIYAQGPANVLVQSVRYRQHAVSQDTRPEVQIIDANLDALARDIRHLEHEKQLVADYLATINKLENFSGSAASSDLSRGLLQFEPLKSLTDYIQGKRADYAKSIVEHEDKLLALEKQVNLLKRQREMLVAGHALTEQEAVLSIAKTDSAAAAIELNYIVDDASWIPQYNLRAKPDQGVVLVEYNALIHQASGEDWNDVKLSLSTAEPAMIAAPPALQPLQIGVIAKPTYGREVSGGAKPASAPVQQNESLNYYYDRSADFRALAKDQVLNARKGKAGEMALNSSSMRSQIVLLNADEPQIAQFKKEAAEIARTEGISVTYTIQGKTRLPSRSDQQLVAIAAIPAKTDFKLVATPILTSYVYLQGQVANDSSTIFLAGAATMFRNDEFVGKGQMPMVTIGEKFTTGFGIDSQVQVVRELESKKINTTWGFSNRVDTHTYRIALSNYKSTPAQLELLDRLPYVEDGSIKIELLEVSPKLVADAEYERTALKKGILKWHLELPAASTGPKATVVRYIFSMEYDKNMQIRGANM